MPSSSLDSIYCAANTEPLDLRAIRALDSDGRIGGRSSETGARCWCAVVGKALEALREGKGVVQVRVTLQ
jgi:hypothetical protein